MRRALELPTATNKEGTVGGVLNSCTWDVGAGESKVQGNLQLKGKFQDTLGT